MEILILGLVLFFGVHLIPTMTGLRGRLQARLGEGRYKVAFSLIAAFGLILTVIGYGRAPAEPRLFAAFPGALAIAPLAMIVSFILLAAAYMKTHMRRGLKHPMLIAVGIWATVHLLANGELRATVLFGAFLGYVVIDLISATQRNAVKPFAPAARQDAIASVVGILLAFAVMGLHRVLFGAAVVPWGI